MIQTESSEQFLAGGGEMGRLIRSMDWSKTPLGPIASWPQSLRTSVSLCLSSTFPILIAWGDETIQIYNDSYRPICGAKHPESMGQNFRICWETALPVVGDAFTRGQQGEGSYIQDQRMFLDRYGYLEEAFMTFSFAPIRDESGEVGGIFHPITETTDKMLSARRTQVLRDVAALTGQAKTNHDIYASLSRAADDFALDLPFLLLYEFEQDGKQARLVSSTGLTAGYSVPANLNELVVAETDWLADLNEPLVIDRLAERIGSLVSGPYPEPPHTAVRLAIRLSTKEEPVGFLLAGVSPRRALDQDYLNFYALLTNTINTAFSNVYAYQQEQKRAEELAAIDRAKTAFFSNISHEFRTPLTLMLGPLEELLRDPALLDSPYKEPVEATQRNAQRLLKLVNNLLDFSRIEAGRVKASYRAVDLAGLTTDLASSFRSLIERAGLDYTVDCQPLPSTVYVDAEMWEKIVLNLLSNAFKYTLHGSIRVGLGVESGNVVLRVSDTGVGIPESEIPHMFERFHRVENAGGRTYEGSGIGLSLVHELVRLHGGTIRVASVVGEGSTFTVRLPLGKAHLPAGQVSESEQENTLSRLADSFVQEASTMLEKEEPIPSPKLLSDAYETDRNTVILVVDDNADMRAYLTRLLARYYTVRTARNGAEALQQLAETLPQLILSDIMMPVMDGKEMLRQIRQNPATNQIPLIFLSARAGQEARVDGLEAGADDYLGKPFSANELLARVRTHLALARVRQENEQQLQALFEQAPIVLSIVGREPDFTYRMANAAFAELVDRPLSQILHKPLLEALPELKGQGFDDLLRQVATTGVPYVQREAPVTLQRDGQTQSLYFDYLYQPLRGPGGDITGVMGLVIDVTQQVLARHKVEESERRFRQLADFVPAFVWTTDPDGHADYFNQRWYDYTGLTPAQCEGANWGNALHPDDRPDVEHTWAEAVRDGQPYQAEYRLRRHDGHYRWFLSAATPFYNEVGMVTKWFGTCTDIHDQRTATEGLEHIVAERTESLRQTNSQLERSNFDLMQFASVASHDLKEPLRKVQTFGTMLQEQLTGRLTPQETDLFGRMIRSTARMQALVSDVLRLSKLADQTVEFERVNVNAVISQIQDDLELTIRELGAEFTIGSLPTVWASPGQMHQLFLNLISNALKFNNSPVPTICIETEPLSRELMQKLALTSPDYTVISVTDNGIGFDSRYADKIFGMFQRLHGRSHYEGTGIGLTIVRKIIDNHRGYITADGRLGQGATFRIVLPASVVPYRPE